MVTRGQRGQQRHDVTQLLLRISDPQAKPLGGASV